jgi:hypothetical protein
MKISADCDLLDGGFEDSTFVNKELRTYKKEL